MIDEAVAIIARNTQTTVKFVPPSDPEFRQQFGIGGTWKYQPPSEKIKVAMSYEQYVRQRMLIDSELQTQRMRALGQGSASERVTQFVEPAESTLVPSMKK